jgi:hypothetical protein
VKRIGLLVFMSAAAAMVSCTEGLQEGSATGTMGGTAIDATIDASSTFHLQYRTSCTTFDQSVYHLSYGGGALQIDFQFDGGPSIFNTPTYTVPTTGAPLLSFTVTPATPALASGTVTVGIGGLLGRRTGSFHLVFDDGSTVDGSFDLPYETSGTPPSCGGSSGGGGDFD